MIVQIGMKPGTNRSTEMKRNAGLTMRRRTIDHCSVNVLTSSIRTVLCVYSVRWTGFTRDCRLPHAMAASSTCIPLNQAFIGLIIGESFDTSRPTSLFSSFG